MLRSVALVLAAGMLVAACNKPGEQAQTPVSQAAYSDQAAADSLPPTEVTFDKTEYNFGKIGDGEKVMYTFKFKNTGTQPLQILGVKPSCGCTAPDWTREAVAPGEEGYIKFEFDSRGRVGMQKKQLIVTANTKQKTHILMFSGEVLAAPTNASR